MVERVSPSLSQERPGLAFCFIDYVNVKHYIINAGGWFRFYKNRETLKEWFAKIHLPNTFAKARNQEMVLSKRCFNARQINESNAAKKVKNTFEEYRKTQDYKTSILSTANTLKLSKASVTSYLPYKKGVYFQSTAEKEKISVGAERQRRYRAMKRWRADPTEENFWGVVLAYAGVKFKTYSGLPFSYEIKKGKNGEYTKELWIDRREKSKSLAWSSVLLALKNIKEEVVERPKALGDIRGVTYIYGMFYRFGLIDVPDEVKEKMGHPQKRKK